MQYNQPNSHTLHSAIHHPLLREWHQTQHLRKKNLVYPIFVTDIPDLQEPITTLPDQYRWGVNKLKDFLAPLVKKGLSSVMIFGVPKNIVKDATGSTADDPNGPVIQSIKLIRENFPNVLITCDVCLCAYTSSGHCGITYEDGSLNSVDSCERLAEVSLNYSKAGCHVLSPSDMMDNRVAAIKKKLFENNLVHKCSIMTMSAKYASSFYGPFRDAVQTSSEFGNRKCYQLPPPSRILGKRAVIRDYQEGSDIILVKPMLAYLDMIREASESAPVPIATYQVSGEYSMLWHSAKAGVFDLKDAVIESLNSAMRAGATILVTYYTPYLLDWIDEENH